MTVEQAVRTRRSVRSFKSDPIEPEKLERILTAASRAPSWANTQPWEVFAASGDTLARIRRGYRLKYEAKEKAAPETPFPKEWSESARGRTAKLGPGIKDACGEEAAARFGALNQDFFRAPCVIWVCLDNRHGEWSLYDIGAWSQSLMLCAFEEGLGTIPAITTSLYPDVLRKELGVPDHLRIAIGIAIGYPDESDPINRFVSERCPLSENVRILN